MPRDLLSELQQRRIEEGHGDAEDEEEQEKVVIEMENNNSELGDFKIKVQQVQEGIERIKDYTERVRNIHAAILSSADTNEKNEELEDIMADVKRLASRIRASIKEIQTEAEASIKENPTSATSRMKLVQQQALSKLFVDSMTAYNDAQMEYRDKCKQRIQRQLAITGKETTDEELEEMIAGNFDVFTQGIITETAKNKQALADVEARHKDIKKLEQSIVELRDLFLEMAVLIESQGTMIDRIEHNVVNAAEFVQQAKTETKIAREYQRSAFKKKIWLYAIILVVIAIIIIYFSV